MTPEIKPADEQVEIVAKAMNASFVHTIPWEHSSNSCKEEWRKAAHAIIPLAQLPWGEPTKDEVLEWTNDLIPRAFLSKFVRNRNAALHPKPVDPRLTKLIEVLGNHEIAQYDKLLSDIFKAFESEAPK